MAKQTAGLLTKREDEVLTLVADGLSNEEIAAHLGLSYETVKEHVQNILRKIGVNNRVKAAVWVHANRPLDETLELLHAARKIHADAIERIDRDLARLEKRKK